MQSLGYADPRVVEASIIAKSAETGHKVDIHQDGCSLFTNPSSGIVFWYALEDTTVENGCLEVAPGTHRAEPLKCRAIVGECGRVKFIDVDTSVPANVESDAPMPVRGSDGEYLFKKLEVKAGTLVMMHGNTLHTSAANKSSKNRLALKFSVVEGSLEWLEDAYLKPTGDTDGFEKLVALY